MKNLNGLSRAIHRVGFQFKKHSPEILMGVGIIGTVASTVLACKATLKVNDILEQPKKDIERIHECANNVEMIESGKYTEKDAKKDLTIVYTQAGIKLVKNYAPAVIVGALSIGCILSSYKIMHTRNVAIGAAYAAVDKGFKDYRKRVKERFGEEVDRELKHNIKAKTVEVIEANEDGKEEVKTKTIEVMGNEDISEFAVFFDEASPYWVKNAEYNKIFLRAQERYANEKLKANGFLYLNEVYEALGIPRTAAGQQVGWVYDEKNPIGDNYVDFGLYDISRPATRDFINGYEKVILLDFNVDGNILQLMR